MKTIGYNKYFESKNPISEIIRFGKKVDYSSKVSNEQLMEEHLKQIRDKMNYK